MFNWVGTLIGKFIGKKLNLQEDSKMDGTKKWFQSQTIWAGIVGTIRGIYLLLQVSLPTFTSVHLPDIPPWVDGILTTVLGGTVIQGRTTATDKIG